MSDNWEYKIMFARQGEFANENHLESMLRQEARAGWVIAEKYSDTYVRLRRPAYARQFDWQLPRTIDPYRTVYTLSLENQIMHLIFFTVCVMAALIILVLLVMIASWPR